MISQLDDFYYQMCEDWHLWDESTNGPYPIQRVFDAFNNFIENIKALELNNDNKDA
jgi:hypothetical protein